MRGEPFLRCPEKLKSGPRKGEVCGARYRPPHKACARCRPQKRDRRRPHNREAQQRTRAKKARALRTAGIPAGWVF